MHLSETRSGSIRTVLLLGTTVCVMLDKTAGLGTAAYAGAAGWTAFAIVSFPHLKPAVRGIVVLTAAITAACLVFGDLDAGAVCEGAVHASFFGAFFPIMGLMQECGSRSRAMLGTARWLASLRPHGVLAALHAMGHVMSIFLGVGSLGFVHTVFARSHGPRCGESVPLDGGLPKRWNMASLVSILRGNLTAFSWAPTSTTFALLLPLYPEIAWDDVWASALGLSMVFFALSLAFVLWSVRATPLPRQAGFRPGGAADLLLPLAALLATLLMLAIGVMLCFPQLRFLYALLLVIPFFCAAWLFRQYAKLSRRAGLVGMGRRLAAYARTKLPGQANIITVLGSVALLGYVLDVEITPAETFHFLLELDMPDNLLLLLCGLCVIVLSWFGVHTMLLVGILAGLFGDVEMFETPATVIVVALCMIRLLGATVNPMVGNMLITAQLGNVPTTELRRTNLPFMLAGLAIFSLWLVG